MTPDLERQLKDLFTEQVSQLDAPPDLAMRVRRRVRDQRRRTMSSMASVAAAGLLLAAGGWWATGWMHQHTAPTGAGDVQSSAPAGITQGQASSCIQTYSPRALAEAGLAFDGTVTAIEDSAEYSFERRVTFEVNEWFTGGSRTTAAEASGPQPGRLVIDMPAPSSEVTSSEALSYAIGDRLLVSGASRRGQGVPVDAVAWGCGFTMPYSTETAVTWREVTAGH